VDVAHPGVGLGFYVTINETDFAGRRRENIVRVRAVFVDADEDLPGVVGRLQGLLPTSAIVRSSAGRAQFYWWVDDFPVEQFEPVQRALIAKLRTDRNVYDLPRVMRLPGTLHLKSEPQLVTMKLDGPTRYSMKAIVDGLGLLRDQLGGCLRRPARHPACRRREARPGFCTEREN
jgi:hypothetical protein